MTFGKMVASGWFDIWIVSKQGDIRREPWETCWRFEYFYGRHIDAS